MSVSDHSLFVKIGERRIGNMGSDNQVFFIGSLKIKRTWSRDNRDGHRE